nr:MAG TPA: hypothetical protein [Caudoviricetes sp.]
MSFKTQIIKLQGRPTIPPLPESDRQYTIGVNLISSKINYFLITFFLNFSFP